MEVSCVCKYVYDSFCLDLPFVYLLARVLSLCPLMAFLRPHLWESLPVNVCSRGLRPSLTVRIRPTQVLWAAPPAD